MNRDDWNCKWGQTDHLEVINSNEYFEPDGDELKLKEEFQNKINDNTIVFLYDNGDLDVDACTKALQKATEVGDE